MAENISQYAMCIESNMAPAILAICRVMDTSKLAEYKRGHNGINLTIFRYEFE